MSGLTAEEKEIQDYCRKAGQAPLTKDELKMVKYGIYLAPQMAHTKKLEEDCPDCKGEKTKLVKRPNGRETRIDYRCPTCQGTGKKLTSDRKEIVRILWNYVGSKLTNERVDILAGQISGLPLDRPFVDRPELEKEIYDIVLAIRTEGIIRGKTKRFAQSDTKQILALMEGK